MTAIKYPKNQDLRELVRFSCETGHIWLAESRMLMLHASALDFVHPVNGEPMAVKCAAPF